MNLMRGHGARFESISGKPVAVSYGEVRAEYDALVAGAGVIDLSHTTRVLHMGREALGLLQRLTTNDLDGLDAREIAATVLTSEIGRVIDLFQVVRLRPDRLMLISDSTDPDPLVVNIDKYTILEDAVLEDVSSATARVVTQGPQARVVAAEVAGAAVYSVDAGRVQPLPDFGEGAILLKGNPPVRDGYDLVLPVDTAAEAWTAAVNAGAVPVGRYALEHARIKAGIPAPGSELNDRVNPLEAGLEEFVSFTKGCYVGQEVIARLDTYDKVQRRLVRLNVSEGTAPGESLQSGQRTAGWVTSVSRLPDNGRAAALGFVRRAFVEPGTVLNSEAGEVTVVDVPSPVAQ